ncbi:hypothetical protein Tco_0737498 [Tanacetum coccineum]
MKYYLRITLLLNDMNIYKMPYEVQFIKLTPQFLNTLPDEWSKFVTDVKLVKDLHTTNVDQLHAYLQQHERHANEVQAQASGQANKEEITFLADPRLPDIQNLLQKVPQPINLLLIKPMIWMPMTLIEMNSTPPRCLMANLSRNAQCHSTEESIQIIRPMIYLIKCQQLRTTELDRYKEGLRDLKEKQNVENSFQEFKWNSMPRVVTSKQNLFEQVQENDTLMKTVF